MVLTVLILLNKLSKCFHFLFKAKTVLALMWVLRDSQGFGEQWNMTTNFKGKRDNSGINLRDQGISLHVLLTGTLTNCRYNGIYNREQRIQSEIFKDQRKMLSP